MMTGRTWAVRAALLALVLGQAGCGLGEYEEKMRGAQARVQLFDEENRLLEGPLVAPQETDPKTNQVSDVAPVFFRPPKGISLKRDDKRPDRLRYRYPPTQSGGAFVGLDLALAKGEDDLAVNKVVASWFPGQQVPPLRKLEMGPLTFETTEVIYGKTTACAVYVTPKQKDRTQAAVVFYLDASRRGPSAPWTSA
jgi:hypothetical protein